MIRLAIIVNSFPVVSETFIFNKVVGLERAGLDISVHVQNSRSDESFFRGQNEDALPTLGRALTANGLKVMPFRVGRVLMQHPTRSLHLWRKASALYGPSKRALKAFVMALPLHLGEYEIIHFEYSGLAINYLDTLPLLKPARLLTSCRGAAEQIMPLVQPERAKRLARLFPLLDRVHCVTVDMRDTLLNYGLRPEQAFINYPSIDIDLFRRSFPYPLKQHGPYQLLSVGRLHWKKGFEYGLLAVQRLVEKGYDVTYTIVGSGPEEEQLRFCIHDLKLEARVRLLGKQPAPMVRQLLDESDVFLLPSISEGLSNAVLEAMAMELPVVTTKAGGMSEAITDGFDGFLVLPRDPCALAARVEVLLRNSELRQKMGTTGRRTLEERFTLQRQIERFIQEYQILQIASSEKS